MARSIKVVFRQDVRGVAEAGDVKTVSPGYARNYLLPQRLAFMATPSALRQWETERQGAIAHATRLREAAKSQAEKIETVTLTMAAKASAEGKLFGSIGRQDILEALQKEGITLEKKALVLAEPLRQVGAATVAVRLGSGQDAVLKVNIVAEQG